MVLICVGVSFLVRLLRKVVCRVWCLVWMVVIFVFVGLVFFVLWSFFSFFLLVFC